jgi:hypothetical protein
MDADEHPRATTIERWNFDWPGNRERWRVDPAVSPDASISEFIRVHPWLTAAWLATDEHGWTRISIPGQQRSRDAISIGRAIENAGGSILPFPLTQAYLSSSVFIRG